MHQKYLYMYLGFSKIKSSSLNFTKCVKTKITFKRLADFGLIFDYQTQNPITQLTIICMIEVK